MERTFPDFYSETVGEGPDVVFVHGWGMHSGLWRDFAERFADRFRVTLFDLPGHGRSPAYPEFTLAAVTELLLERAPEKAHWLGWSLGGLIALHAAARTPSRVDSLTLLAANARFVSGPGWTSGLNPQLLMQFGEDMMADYQTTLSRFLTLQLWGQDNARPLLVRLRERIGECPEPDLQALRDGLRVLLDADLRDALSEIRQPLMILLGARDTLVPAAAGAAMRELTGARTQMHVLDGAAHIPFLSHPDQCASLLVPFWQSHGQC